MTLPTNELLARLSDTLRNEIGPAVEHEYTRTQAFMASVILERLSRQVELAPSHREAERDDLGAMYPDLRAALGDAPAEVTAALGEAEASGEVAGLGGLIEALYGWGIDEPAAAAALDRIRLVLRLDIDRRMAIAR